MAVFLTNNSKRFTDVSLSFEANPVTGDLTTLLNERAINNALKNLMMITPTEVPFQADIGSGIPSYLFETFDEVTADLISREIERVIKLSEPRVELVPQIDIMNITDDNTRYITGSESLKKAMNSVIVEPRPEQNTFVVTITYKIVGYDQIITFSHLLEPTR
jgi:phage baseplate assembly protein W